MANPQRLTARVSSKGQIALPKPVRDQLGLTEGSDLAIRIEGDEVILGKLVPRAWREWQARFKGSSQLEDRAVERRRERARDVDRPWEKCWDSFRDTCRKPNKNRDKRRNS